MATNAEYERILRKPAPLTEEQWAAIRDVAAETEDLQAAIRHYQQVEVSRWHVRALAAESFKRNPEDLETLRKAACSDGDVNALLNSLLGTGDYGANRLKHVVHVTRISRLKKDVEGGRE